MVAYEHLPIFQKRMDLTVFVEQMVSRFSRYHRYTWGTELRGMCHEALGLVMAPNNALRGNSRSSAADIPPEGDRLGPAKPSEGIACRREVLPKLRNILERIKIHLILAREVQAFSSKNAFSRATELVIDLTRQNEGWLKSTN
jgi:hypothetical protein